jgi:hypothetical protein
MRMGMRVLVPAVAAALLAGTACAADTPVAPVAPAQKEQGPAKKKKKPMKMNEPMANEMKKEGMTKGEVKKAAEQQETRLEPMMKQEEKTMPK